MTHTFVKLICSFVPLLLFSCEGDDIANFSTEYQILKENYAGTYKIISSKSLSDIDLNNDGILSNNLIEENSEISESYMQIKISHDDIMSAKGSGYIEQFRPEQYLILDGKTQDVEKIEGYNPSIRVVNLLQGSLWNCKINKQEKIISIIDKSFKPSTTKLWTTPSNILIKGKDQIMITTEKAFYTTKGWQTVVVESVYERRSPLT